MSILTISRQFGSGGREMGQAASSLTGYAYVDKKQILEEIKSYGDKWLRWAEDMDEHCPTVWEKNDWSFRGFVALSHSIILDYAAKDRCIIMGRGANIALKGIPFVHRVRVVAPEENRIERIMERESLDRQTAKSLMKKTDKSRECLLKVVFGSHWGDSSEYDQVIDTGSISIEEASTALADALKEKESLRTEQSLASLRLRASAARVKAGIMTNEKFFIPTLEVFPEGDGIIVRGVIHNPDEHKKIEAEAIRLAEGLHVKCELHYRGK